MLRPRLLVPAVLVLALAAAPCLAADGYIGVQIRQDADNKGVQVVDTVEDGPAAKAGVKKDDLITKVDGKEVGDLQAFVQTVRDTKPGDKITLTVVRDGKEVEVKVTVGEKPSQEG